MLSLNPLAKIQPPLLARNQTKNPQVVTPMPQPLSRLSWTSILTLLLALFTLVNIHPSRQINTYIYITYSRQRLHFYYESFKISSVISKH